MKNMKNGWKKLILMLIILPLVAFFPACSCSEENTSSSTNPQNNTYIVHFYTNTEETFNIPNQVRSYGDLLTEPSTPTKYGYTFVGWYMDEDFKTRQWDFNLDVVTQSMTLYARWREIK